MTKLCAHCQKPLDLERLGSSNYLKQKYCDKACYRADFRRPELVAARFWAKVEKREDGCWIWKGCRSSVTKYGTFRFGKSNINAHRAAWLLTYGPIEGDGIDVLHTCHNGHLGCVRPDHLYLGTDKENSRDRVLVGRGFKFNADQIREIRRLSADGKRDAELAIQFATSPRYIWGIRTRRAWKHVT